MSAAKIDALAQAEHLAENMKLLATEYQAVVRATPESDQQGQRARRSLDRKFQKLKSRKVIDGLREDGHAEVAAKLDELFGACAGVFNLVAVSIGVDEKEVLEIDIEGPFISVLAELARQRDLQ